MKKIIFLVMLTVINVSAIAQSWQLVGPAGFSTGGGATYVSLAIDGSGTPYIAYQEAYYGSKASVMKFDGTSWVIVGAAGFSAGAANYTSLAINSSGTPYVAYSDNGSSGKATVMKFDGTNWVTVGAAGFSAGSYGVNFVSLAIDGNGNPYVAYQEVQGSKANAMKFDGTSWVIVGAAGFSAGGVNYVSLAIDGNGTPYVAYEDGVNSNKATMMKFDGANWVTVGAAGFSAGTAEYISLKIDGSGTPYVAYRDYVNSLKATVMKFDGTNWVTVGAMGFSANQANYTSLAINSSGTPYVAYGDVLSAFVWEATVMKFDGTNWVLVGAADFSAGGTEYTSLALDNNGTPYVAYQDEYNGSNATVMKFGSSSEISENNFWNKISIYPNPSNGKFILNPAVAQGEITIYNVLGEKIYSVTGKRPPANYGFDISHFETGIYFMKICEGKNNYSEKIVIQ